MTRDSEVAWIGNVHRHKKVLGGGGYEGILSKDVNTVGTIKQAVSEVTCDGEVARVSDVDHRQGVIVPRCHVGKVPDDL